MGMMMGRMMIGWNEGYLALTLLIITNQLTSFNADGKDDGTDDVRMIWRIFRIRQAFFVSLYEQHILVFLRKMGMMMGIIMLGWYEGYLAITLLIWTSQLTSFNADG